MHDSLSPQIPYIEISRHPYASNRLVATPHNHEWHDNSARMPFLCDYMNVNVLPHIVRTHPESATDIVHKRFFPLEPHDSYSYLVEEKYHDLDTVSWAYDRGDLMSFARRKGHESIVLLPDIYFMSDWGSRSYTGGFSPDTIDFGRKPYDTVTFFGSSTGGRSPDRNRRIQWCRWAQNIDETNEKFTFKITRLVQMPQNSVSPDEWNRIGIPNPVHPSQQMQHKFIMNIEGNTCRFDVWPLATNCLVFVDAEAKDELVYSPELKSGEHVVEVDMQSIDKMRTYYVNNPREAARITDNANRLARKMFTPENCTRYAASAVIKAACTPNP